MVKENTILKLSIVIPVLNGEKYLEETLRSICHQDETIDLEIIVQDGGSSDRTLDIVAEFKEQFPKIHWDINSEKDKNLYEAIVKGLEKAQGEIVTWISSTDYYSPHSFSTVSEIFTQNQHVHWLSGIPLSYNEKGQAHYFKTPVFYSSQLIQQGFYDGKKLHFIQQESCFMRKSALDKVDIKQILRYPHAGDQMLWNMLSRQQDLYIVNTFLAGSRQHQNRISNSDLYYKEFEELSTSKTFAARLMATLQYIATYFFPEKLKRMMAPRLFEYRDGKWRM